MRYLSCAGTRNGEGIISPNPIVKALIVALLFVGGGLSIATLAEEKGGGFVFLIVMIIGVLSYFVITNEDLDKRSEDAEDKDAC